jgi:hypothetical protein
MNGMLAYAPYCVLEHRLELIVLLLLLLLFVTYMEGIYNNVPEANQVPRECNFGAILCLQYMVQRMAIHMLNNLYSYVTIVLSEV